MVNDDLEVGGVQRLVVDLSNMMIGRRIVVGVLARPGGVFWSHLVDEVQNHSLEWRNGRGVLRRLRLGLSLRALVRREGYRLVHAHQRGVALVARMALIGTGVRVVEHVHSEFSSGRIGALISFRGHHLIACGSAIRRMLTERYRRDPERVTLVRNSIADIWAGEPLDLPCRSSGRITVLAVGSLLEVKDPARFIRVMARVSTRHPWVTAEWVGDGPLRDEVNRMVAASKNGPVFSGPSSEVTQKILGSDVVMLTSRREGLPLVILEAMAMGRPVIAPNVGSCGDVVETDVNGVLYARDVSDSVLVETVVDCIDVENLTRWGTASRKRFETLGDFSRVVDEVIEVYDRVQV